MTSYRVYERLDENKYDEIVTHDEDVMFETEVEEYILLLKSIDSHSFQVYKFGELYVVWDQLARQIDLIAIPKDAEIEKDAVLQQVETFDTLIKSGNPKELRAATL